MHIKRWPSNQSIQITTMCHKSPRETIVPADNAGSIKDTNTYNKLQYKVNNYILNNDIFNTRQSPQMMWHEIRVPIFLLHSCLSLKGIRFLLSGFKDSLSLFAQTALFQILTAASASAPPTTEAKMIVSSASWSWLFIQKVNEWGSNTESCRRQA